VIVQRDRPAEDRQETVAPVADQGAVVPEDRVDHLAEVRIQQVDDLLRLGCLGERREPFQVGDHHRPYVAAAAEPQVVVRPLEHVLHDVRSNARGRRSRCPWGGSCG